MPPATSSAASRPVKGKVLVDADTVWFGVLVVVPPTELTAHPCGLYAWHVELP